MLFEGDVDPAERTIVIDSNTNNINLRELHDYDLHRRGIGRQRHLHHPGGSDRRLRLDRAACLRRRRLASGRIT